MVEGTPEKGRRSETGRKGNHSRNVVKPRPRWIQDVRHMDMYTVEYAAAAGKSERIHHGRIALSKRSQKENARKPMTFGRI